MPAFVQFECVIEEFGRKCEWVSKENVTLLFEVLVGPIKTCTESRNWNLFHCNRIITVK
jgi:hypothetical protein